uniref:ShKT domain-containing protein n=1 Tax=Chrysotila carterae TaxID=13221 RepID=A0A7S4EVS4_CHRCT
MPQRRRSFSLRQCTGDKACEGGKPCMDVNQTECAVWGLRGECKNNPNHMYQRCPQTCGVCTNVCEDKYDDCATWADNGECESNKDVMSTECPASCGLCAKLEHFYHHIFGIKDEL